MPTKSRLLRKESRKTEKNRPKGRFFVAKSWNLCNLHKNWRPLHKRSGAEFVKIHSFSNFFHQFFVQYYHLHFPAIHDTMTVSRGEPRQRKVTKNRGNRNVAMDYQQSPFQWLPIGTIRLRCELVTRAQKQAGEVDEVAEIIKIVANILRKPLDKLQKM